MTGMQYRSGTVVIHDTATPKLKEMLAASRRPLSVMQAVAKEVIKVFKDRFKKLQAKGNRRGWPERHFWYGLATSGSVSSKVGITKMTPSEAIVSVSDYRYLHKIKGGTIKPKRKNALTIPLRAEAYALGGKGSVRESAPFLKLVITKKGAWLVKETLEKTMHKIGGKRASRTSLEFWFRLLPYVWQAPQAYVEPSRDEIIAGIERAAAAAGPRLLKLEARRG